MSPHDVGDYGNPQPLIIALINVSLFAKLPTGYIDKMHMDGRMLAELEPQLLLIIKNSYLKLKKDLLKLSLPQSHII